MSLGAELQEVSSGAGLVWGKNLHLLFSLFKKCFVEVAKQAQDSLQMPALGKLCCIGFLRQMEEAFTEHCIIFFCQ